MLTRSLIILCLAATTQALTSLGPPTTNMKQGQLAISAQAGVSLNDIVNEHTAPNTQYQNVYFDSALAGLHVGLDSDRVELYGLIGGGGINNAGLLDMNFSQAYESTFYTSGGGGVRITTNLGRSLSWGIAAQTVFYQNRDWKLLDTQVGIGPCWRPVINRRNGDTFMLYGGALLNWIDGSNRGGTPSAKLSEQDWYGLYIGTGFELFGGTTALLIEEMVTPSSYGGSIRLKIRM